MRGPRHGRSEKRQGSAASKAAIHLVSAWAEANRLVLGQLKVDAKSNEITAIPTLLRLLHLKDCIVTIDAMGCQKDIAQTIVSQEADYVLALKANHGTLYDNVKLFLEDARAHGFQGLTHRSYDTVDADHGRLETRTYWITSELDWLGLSPRGPICKALAWWKRVGSSTLRWRPKRAST